MKVVAQGIEGSCGVETAGQAAGPVRAEKLDMRLPFVQVFRQSELRCHNSQVSGTVL